MLALLLTMSAVSRGQERISEMLGEQDPALQEIQAQIEAQEYDYPILWLEDNVRAIERANHRYHPELIQPLTLLGDAKVGKGDYDGALEAYERAVHVTRVNDGLIAASQVDIVYREANAYKAMGAYKEANDREEYAYHVLTRSHEPYDEALLPGILHLARWYGQTQNIFSARALYQHAINVLAANGKLTDESAIPAYEGIAQTYRLERFPRLYTAVEPDPISKSQFSPGYQDHISINNFPAGERALQRIIQIRREDPDVEAVVLGEAILDLADWYLLFDKTRRANPLYEHVYSMLSEVDGFSVADYFAEPVLLYFPLPEEPRAPPVEHRGELQSGFVEISYTVSDTGYVRDMATIASEPKGLMDFRVRKSLRLTRYRPSIVEGIPVTKPDHIYRHEFSYYPKLELADANEATTESDDNQ